MYPLVEPRQRPERFLLNRFSPLAESPLLLGLGGFDAAGSVWYPDARRLLGGVPNDGTLTGMDPATAWSRDLGRAVTAFDGSNDYIDVGNASVGDTLDLTNNFTITLFANQTAVDTNYRGLLCRGGRVTQYAILVRSGALRFYDSDALAINQAAFSAGVTRHVAVVQTGTTATLYLDGSFVTTGTGSVIASTANAVTIGYEPGGSYWNGWIGDPIIHARPLSPGEISALADPSNVMLEVGGVPLILPPHRVSFPAAVAEPSGFKPYWARPSSQIIGGGIAA